MNQVSAGAASNHQASWTVLPWHQNICVPTPQRTSGQPSQKPIRGTDEPLVFELERAAGGKYRDLYEEPSEAQAAQDLQAEIVTVLDLLASDPRIQNDWRKLGWVVLGVVASIEPTWALYRPRDPELGDLLTTLERWLRGERGMMVQRPRPAIVPEAPQAMTEARLVVRDAWGIFDQGHAKECTTGVVLDCVTGFAIAPGVSARREIWEWWLREVVVSALFARRPIPFRDWRSPTSGP